jgi:hypothetical protein
MSITNANSRTLSQSAPTVPNVQDAMRDWFQPLIFILIQKSVVNFELKEVQTIVQFQGIIESLTPTQLAMKPEGQRNWNFINIWAYPDLVLSMDDIFQYNGKNYRVTSRNDWSQYGYVNYDAAEDYT